MCSRAVRAILGVEEVIAALAGTWRGAGIGHYPTVKDFSFTEEIEFKHTGKPMLIYSQKTWNTVDNAIMHIENGFLRILPEGKLEFVCCDPTGVAQSYAGSITRGDNDVTVTLETNALALTPTAKEVNGLRRELTIENNKLKSVLHMQAVGQPMQEHIVSTLTKQ